MENDEKLLIKRFSELSERSRDRGYWVFSDFLTMAEQSTLISHNYLQPFTLFGGYENAERRIACFGSEDSLGYTEEPPVICIKISPLSQKFADKLSHRDFLGALMGLGIKRETLGDIVIEDNCGYLFCLETVSGYIVEQFNQVKHTSVKCTVCESAPTSVQKLPDLSSMTAASERIDALIAAVYGLSRSEAQRLISQKLVYVNGKLTESSSYCPQHASTVSVRGHGRFIYEGTQGETRRGRLRISVRVF